MPDFRLEFRVWQLFSLLGPCDSFYRLEDSVEVIFGGCVIVFNCCCVIFMSHDFHHNFRINFSAFLKIRVGMTTGIRCVVDQMQLLHENIKASGTPVIQSIESASRGANQRTSGAVVDQCINTGVQNFGYRDNAVPTGISFASCFNVPIFTMLQDMCFNL